MRRIACLSALLRVMLLMTALTAWPARAEIVWHWEDRFSAAEQHSLQTWITRTLLAVEDLVAPLPFDVHVHFYRLADRGEPVPWANTRRGRTQGVNFHVDPAFPADAFYADWTAAHELSHLLIPSLSEASSWFAEGFASYMQYQVMQHMAVLDADEISAAYRKRIERAENLFRHPGMPFVIAARALRLAGDYPTYYWGGATYFLRADMALRRRASGSLSALLSDYIACCRDSEPDIAQLVQQFDRLLGKEFFTDLLLEFQTRPGFPRYRDALRALAADSR